ncbi:MAG: type I secretion system permease/ATPase [Thermovirgaceae bacterium]
MNGPALEEQRPGEVPEYTLRGGPLAASLSVLSSFHGVHASVDTLLAGLPLENGRLTPSLFSRAAERAGLLTRVVRTPLDRLNPVLFPAVLILAGNNSCVIFSVDKEAGKARVAFPEVGPDDTEIGLEELGESYTGFAIYARPRFQFDERAVRTKELEKEHWFWGVISEHRHLYRDIIVASVLSNLIAFSMPLFVMNVYNRVVPNRAVESLWVMAIGVFVMITADFVIHMTRGYLVDLAAAKTNVKLSREMMEHVLDMRSEERSPSVGSFAGSIQGFDSVRSFISSATVLAYVDLPFALLFFLVIALISWTLVIPLLVASGLILLHAVLVQGQMRELSETTSRASSLKNATLIESLVAMETVKSLGAEGHIQSRWEKTVAFLERTNIKLRLLSSSVVNSVQWVQMAASIATMVVGVYLIMSNSISMGSLIATYLLSSRAIAPIGRVAALLMQYHSASRSLKALDEIMQKETERPAGSVFISTPRVRGSVQFRGVSFTYPGQESTALSDVSFTIGAGEKVALLGPIGSGKTTVNKLVLGLFRPQEGSILIDGRDIRQIDPSELRKNIGVVPQDVMLFYGNLKDNLLFGSPAVTDREILLASWVSGVEMFANTHPKGFDMPIGERGSFLSSGQRQAVAIARAIIKNPPILVLDEPTASMDHVIEEHIKKNLAALVKDKTVILTTHRTPLLSLVDRLIVMDRGKIVADGPKEKVLKALQEGQVRRTA